MGSWDRWGRAKYSGAFPRILASERHDFLPDAACFWPAWSSPWPMWHGPTNPGPCERRPRCCGRPARSRHPDSRPRASRPSSTRACPGRESRPASSPGSACPKAEPGKTVPGIVLVHGGGGTAFAEWVGSGPRGYAAIAMDTCGHGPEGEYGKWDATPSGGPPGGAVRRRRRRRRGPVALPRRRGRDPRRTPCCGRCRRSTRPDRHHRHLLGRLPDLHRRGARRPPEVRRPGLRLRVPRRELRVEAADSRRWASSGQRWLAMWDPTHYLPGAKMPMLWVTGTNDFAYPMDSLRKSYRLPAGDRRSASASACRTATARPARTQGDPRLRRSIVNGGPPLCAGSRARPSTGWTSRCPSSPRSPVVKAEFDLHEGPGAVDAAEVERWPGRRSAASATTAKATLPAGTAAYYVNIDDERGRVVSTRHATISPPGPGRPARTSC